jgi:hypothetical protein
VQWDTSEHDWLEGRGEEMWLIAMIDDATSKALARFVRHDSTEENLKLLREYIHTHGRPLAAYTDKASQTAPKGRIERFFGTAQDGLVKGLRKHQVSTVEQANRYLTEIYLPIWHQRFSQEPLSARRIWYTCALQRSV